MEKTHNIYICHDGRKLTLDRTEVSKSKGFERKFKVYLSEDCSNCTYKSDCLYKYDERKHKDKNKTMKINERWDSLKEESNKNIQEKLAYIDKMAKEYFEDTYDFPLTSSYSFLFRELKKKGKKNEVEFCKEMFATFYSKKKNY